jgi:hypothetical protein
MAKSARNECEQRVALLRQQENVPERVGHPLRQRARHGVEFGANFRQIQICVSSLLFVVACIALAQSLSDSLIAGAIEYEYCEEWVQFISSQS